MLQKALKRAGPALRFSEHMEGADGEAMFRHACALGLEGIVSKRVTRRYKSGSCSGARAFRRACWPSPAGQRGSADEAAPRLFPPTLGDPLYTRPRAGMAPKTRAN